NFHVTLTEVNGASVLIPASFSAFDITTVQTTPGTLATVTGGMGTKTFGTGEASATLDFSITSGFAFTSHLNMDGVITGITANAMPCYDFPKLVGGSISLAIDQPGVKFQNIVNHEKASLVNGFGYAQSSIPEPASMALLGIGMTSLLAFRRYFRRMSTV